MPRKKKAPASDCRSLKRSSKNTADAFVPKAKAPAGNDLSCPTTKGLKFMKILVVEDEQHLAEGLRFNLEAEGYDAELSDTGEKALEMAVQTNFDAIVLDIMLPGIDGFEVASTLPPTRISRRS